MLESPIMRLLLASSSPRRQELLGFGGWSFDVIPAKIDETPLPEEPPRAYVLRMAIEKARVAGERAPSDSLVLGADTAVIDMTPFGEQILGKPVDEADAEDMLRQLRGHVHQVYTAVAVLRLKDGALIHDVCITDVPMRDYTDAEILEYVASGDPMDKAGAYAIQNEDFHPVERLEGCYANVVGLPVCHVSRLLKQFGMPAPVKTVEVCGSQLGYACLFSEQVQKDSD